MLMTLRGLKARHIPHEVIYNFYQHAIQMMRHRSPVKITYFQLLLRNHLNLTANRVFAVIDPLRVTLSNFSEKQTDFILKNEHPMRSHTSDSFKISPLSNTVYIDQHDFSLVNTGTSLSKGTKIKLKYTNSEILCDDVMMTNTGKPVELKTTFIPSQSQSKSIHWISSESGKSPIKARFYIYNWFFTGDNQIHHSKPSIKDGYIEESVFDDLKKIYQVERVGYFIYDQKLTDKNDGIMCFMKICGIH